VAHVVYELDADGKQRRVVTYADEATEKGRALWRTLVALATARKDSRQRTALLAHIEERGIKLEELSRATDHRDADLIDALTLFANKVRQAGITTELMEIVSGAEAMRASS